MYILFLFILLSSEVDIILKEKYSKKDVVRVFGSNRNKIILILLIEDKIFYIWLTTKDV